jgi:alpha-galactosidase
VEVPAWIDRTGINPLRATPLPKKIMLEHILPRILEMERELEAFKTGDRTMLLYNVLMGSQTKSYDQSLAVLDDLLSMEGHEELAAHYAAPTTNAARSEALPTTAGDD